MQNITIRFSNRAEKQLRKLSPKIVDKFHKQIKILLNDPSHPSLGVKKKQGESVYEARIDYHYRFTYWIEDGFILINTLGPHDEGLGKK